MAWLSVSAISALFKTRATLRASSAEPIERVRSDVGEGAGGPVARDLAGRELAAAGLFGEADGVVALVGGAAVAGDERVVPAGRAGVVADVEIGAGLRGGEVEFAARRSSCG